MKRMAIGTLTVLGLGLTASGCALLDGATPGVMEEDSESGGEQTASGTSYAGTWTRASDDEGDLVFEVTDDGQTVSGELVEGGDYASYTFELTREGEGLVGESSVAFPEDPEQVWHSEWEVRLEGDVVQAEQATYEVDPQTGEEVPDTREVLEVSYAFTPAAAAAAAPPPSAAGGGFDPTTMVKAPGQVPVSPDLAVGWAIAREVETAQGTSTVRYAVVGEEGGAWRYEAYDQGLAGMAASFPELKDMVLGLVVDKADGEVSRAVLGEPGEPGKEIGINPVYEAGEQPADPGVAEDVTIGLGTFAARRYENEWEGGFQRSWAGTSGELEGVLLEVESSDGDYELAEMPEETEAAVGGGIPVTVYRYTNGMEFWQTPNEVVRAFFPWAAMPDEEAEVGLYKMVSEGMRQEVVEIETSAEPQLAWE